MNIFNLPLTEYETGREDFWNTVKEYFGDKAIDILEIGVFQAKCIQNLPTDLLNVKSYTGVDPYIGDASDSYLGAYWKNRDGASSVYLNSKQVFEDRGATLIRKTSEEFWKDDTKEYDFIFVDGDHRFEPALWDMCHWFSRLKEGGLLMIDDYGNLDTPQVAPAANAFCAIKRNSIGQMGYFDKTFINSGKYIPLISRYVFFQKDTKNFPKVFTYNNGSSARNGKPEEVKFEKEIVIWGAGNKGQYLSSFTDNDISFFVDSNPELKGKTINGVAVRSPEEIENWDDYFFLVTAGQYSNEIIAYLNDKNLERMKDYFVIKF